MFSFKTLDNTILARIKIFIFILALIPLIKIGILGVLHALGANPVEKITLTTGYWALCFIMISLAIAPLQKLTAYFWLVRLRRMLGLFAFFYASLHFLTYLVLDQFFDWANIVKDIVKRPYITVGFFSFLMLIPLAITSNNRMIKLIGGKRWLLLHRLIYLIATGGVVHFWWLVKKDISRPLDFALILALLLAIRLYYWLRRKILKR